MQQPIDKELIKKYLAGECDPDELERIKAFFRTPGYREVLHEIMEAETSQEWADFLRQPVRMDEQMEKWQSAFRERKEGSTGRQPERSTSWLPWKGRVLKYAAIWAMVIGGIGFLAIHQQKKTTSGRGTLAAFSPAKEIVTKNGQRAKIVLPDQSVVYLGPGSKLQYPEHFTDSNRMVNLAGEAFFEVSQHPEWPFIIQTRDIQTRVLGTSFKINALEGQLIEVQVASGKVRVDQVTAASRRQLAILNMGEVVRWDPQGKAASLSRMKAPDILAWKASKLLFKERTLQDIAGQLERTYDVHIRFQDAQKARELVTVTLNGNEPLSRTLHLLGSGTHFEYRISGKDILIY